LARATGPNLDLSASAIALARIAAQRRAGVDDLRVGAQLDHRRQPAAPHEGQRFFSALGRTGRSTRRQRRIRRRTALSSRSGIKQFGADHSRRVVPFLVHADGPVHAVVEDQDQHGGLYMAAVASSCAVIRSRRHRRRSPRCALARPAWRRCPPVRRSPCFPRSVPVACADRRSASSGGPGGEVASAIGDDRVGGQGACSICTTCHRSSRGFSPPYAGACACRPRSRRVPRASRQSRSATRLHHGGQPRRRIAHARAIIIWAW